MEEGTENLSIHNLVYKSKDDSEKQGFMTIKFGKYFIERFTTHISKIHILGSPAD